MTFLPKKFHCKTVSYFTTCTLQISLTTFADINLLHFYTELTLNLLRFFVFAQPVFFFFNLQLIICPTSVTTDPIFQTVPWLLSSNCCTWWKKVKNEMTEASGVGGGHYHWKVVWGCAVVMPPPLCFSGQLALPSLKIYHQCAAFVAPTFNFKKHFAFLALILAKI